MIIQYTKRKITAGGISQCEEKTEASNYAHKNSQQDKCESNTLLEMELGEFLFKEADCFFGVLPPFAMLNSTLQKGKLFSTHNTILQWKPMRLSRSDYEMLQRSIKNNPQWGGEVDNGFKGSRKYWERWAILRFLDKTTSLDKARLFSSFV